MSRKIATFIAVVIFLSFSSLSFICAQENVWKKTVLKNNDLPWAKIFSEVYLAYVPDGVCMVSIIKDDGGLFVAAQDLVVHVGYFFGIERYNDGDGFLTTYSVLAIRNGKIESGGYNVFREKCLSIAPQLPNQVRKKFRGCLGVK